MYLELKNTVKNIFSKMIENQTFSNHKKHYFLVITAFIRMNPAKRSEKYEVGPKDNQLTQSYIGKQQQWNRNRAALKQNKTTSHTRRTEGE